MSLNVYYDDGRIDPHYVQLYFDEYAKCDVTTSAEFFATIEQPVANTELFSHDELRKLASMTGGPGRRG